MKTIDSKSKGIFLHQTDWEVVRFGDVVDEVKESTTDPLSEGIKYVVGLDHIDPMDLHIRRWDTTEKATTFTRKFKRGQTLFGRRRAYQRKVALAEFDGICSGDIIVMQAKERLDPNLLPFLVQSDEFYKWAVSTSAGSLSPRTKFKHLSEFQFRLPDLPTQKKIIQLLLKIDSLQEQTLHAIRKIEDLFNVYLKEVVQGNSKTPTSTLEKVIDLNYGKGLKESVRRGGEYDVVSSAGICGKHDKYLVEGPGIVVGRKGAVGQVTWLKNNFWPIDTAYYVSLKTKVDLRFVYYLLIALKLSKLSISTAIPGINRSDILATKIQLPSFEDQIQTREKLDALSELLDKYRESLKSNLHLRSGIVDAIL